MAVLTVQSPTATGTTVTEANANAGGDSFPAGQHRVLRINNTDASSHDVIIASQKPCDQGVTHNVTVTVPASTVKEVSNLNPARFADANGYVQLTYSAVTGMKVSVHEG